jgi:cyclopropane-fatty-acyl-phospholipid synthase
MRPVLDRVLKRFIVEGRLSVRYPDGELVTYSGKPGPEAGIEVRTPATLRRLITDPNLAVGETYMDGTLVPLGCTMYDVLNVVFHNVSAGGWHPGNSFQTTARTWLRRWSQWNPAARSRRNVAHHYDLNGQLYSLFLDRDSQYSCAYFPRGDETLEEAQAAKKRHIAAKLLLDRPDLHVLDIGCGWGGMGLTLARDYGARVTGITLSQEQWARASARAEEAGLADRVQFLLLDYRDPALQAIGPFDRVVSVGMFEHVGINHYGQFFGALQRLLAPDGVALVHAIGRSNGPGATNPWLAKYIFPGGYSPALSEVFAAIEPSGLIATDVEILRLHYAETLRHWRRRFAAKRDIVATLYDERFCRMFELYLAGSELAFRHPGTIIWQMQLTRDRAAVPMTREYIAAAERRPLRAHEDAD